MIINLFFTLLEDSYIPRFLKSVIFWVLYVMYISSFSTLQNMKISFLFLTYS